MTAQLMDLDLSTARGALHAAQLVEQAAKAAFVWDNAQRQAHRDPVVATGSWLGGCTRALAFSLSKTPADQGWAAPPDEARAALLGSYEHEGYLPALAKQFRTATVEQYTQMTAAGYTFTGSIDLATTMAILDLKTVGEHRLQGVRRAGAAFQPARVQVFGYILGEIQRGREVRYAIWLYMDRANGELQVIVEPVTNDRVMEVIDRVTLIKDYAEWDPMDAPAEEQGPGLSFVCDRCPWLKRCWGEDAAAKTVGAQANLLITDEDQLQALTELLEATQMTAHAKKLREFALAKLMRVPRRVPLNGLYELRDKAGGSYIPVDYVEQAFRDGVPAGSKPARAPKAGSTSIKLINLIGAGAK